MLGGWDEEEAKKFDFLLFFLNQTLDSSRNNLPSHAGLSMEGVGWCRAEQWFSTLALHFRSLAGGGGGDSKTLRPPRGLTLIRIL